MKRIKMVLYGEPGVGKSVFASKSPKPFFICTDGNYEWLEDFGADPNAHINASSWSEIKSIIDNESNFNDYETVVLDLTEDAFKWCESEYCIRNKIEHVSDIGYGKGYDTSRNEFFLTICKLISYNKNIILIMHGCDVVEKDRRGIEHTKHTFSSRMPDKLADTIEGRVRYFLRAYVKDFVHEDGTVEKRRYLSLVPKPNEFGIIRGVDENKIPQDIPLDWNEFVTAVGFKFENNADESVEKVVEEKPTRGRKPKVKNEQVEIKEEPITDEPIVETKTEEVKEEVKTETEEVKEQTKVLTNVEKLAAIKAKLAALKK